MGRGNGFQLGRVGYPGSSPPARPRRFTLLLALTLASLGLLAGALIPPQASANGPKTLYVNGAAGNDVNSCFVEVDTGPPSGPCKTIQAAVDKAAAGDTIIVAAGEYVENVSVNKQLTLNGPNAGIPDGSNSGTRVPEAVIRGEMNVSAQDTIIDGFRFGRLGENPLNAVKLIRSTSVSGQITVQNNRIDLRTTTAETGCGAGIWGTAAWRIINNGFLNQRYAGSCAVLYDSRAVWAEGAQPIQVNGNRFQNVGQGIYLTGSQPSGSTITNNVFTGTEAIFMGAPTGVLIKGNTFESSGGVYLATSTNTEIENNSFGTGNNWAVWAASTGGGAPGTLLKNNAILGKYGAWAGPGYAGHTVFNFGTAPINANDNWWGTDVGTDIRSRVREAPGVVSTEPWITTFTPGTNPTPPYTTGFWPVLNLDVTRSGSGTGSVTSSPTGINCGSTCAANFPVNSQVTLTATAAAGSTFTGWSGEGCSGTGNCVVTMSQAREVTATFTAAPPPSYLLSVAKAAADTGTGTVTSDPAGINCGATCQKRYDPGTRVTLTATPDPGSRFTGWTGACTNQQGSCEVTMTNIRVVTARFTAADTNPLTVAKQGNGQGTVTSVPEGINCGPTCQANFTSGTQVTLTAAADADSTFQGWSGACSGTGPCQVTMDQARQVTATFQEQVPRTLTLTVTKAGSGTGTVTSTPSGINCGATCSSAFESGTQVTLTATVGPNSTFEGWSGACTGTGPCQVTMDESREVTATFDDPPPSSDVKIELNTDRPARVPGSRVLRAVEVSCEGNAPCRIDRASATAKARKGKGQKASVSFPTAEFPAGTSRVIQVTIPERTFTRLRKGRSGTLTVNVRAQGTEGPRDRTIEVGLRR